MPAFAHHGWGGNVDQVSDMTGTVVKGVSLAGPHATMRINAEGHDWDITLAPPPKTKPAVKPFTGKVEIHLAPPRKPG
ncbi:MAG: hypothetical protein HY055_17405 [Magnetospirillum sp.]|nr:hypothetical protein [Magnetospirillum sp.]